MGVTRRNDSSSWLARSDYSVDGKRPAQSFADKKYGGREKARLQAEQWLKKIDASILEGRFIDPHRNKISLEEFKLKVGIVKLNQRETTKSTLEDVWESYIAPYRIAEMSIGKLADDPSIIANHIKHLKKDNGESYSNSTVVKVVEVFRVLFRKAVEMKYVLNNPATTQIVREWIPAKKRENIHYLSVFEVNKIFKDMQEHSPLYAVMIPLMAYSGLRSGEVRGLHWSDVDFNSASVSITKQFSDKLNAFAPPKNDASIREIKIPQYVIKLLKEQKSNLPADCEFLFPNQKGNQNGSVIVCDTVINGRNFRRRHLKPALARLEMLNTINIHTFRHTSVRIARESGADLLAISKRLGHSSITTTADIYSELFKDIDTELVDKLDEYIAQQQIG
tara:strand:- start:80 stop:1255 length:1176 start_codon:yes stop_codon:yes gene_type:complete